jgi:hypothetical protein
MVNVNNPQDIILIETAHVTRENLGRALAALRGCWKASSLLWMHANDFPALSGLILNGWFSESEESVVRFCRQRNFSELLVRIEKPDQRWIRRRGGYNAQVEHVRGIVQALAEEGLIAILLEPASPYSDLFSLTSACEVDAGKIDIEVVGPGFDASDILRADITPHERFEIKFDSRSKAAWGRHQVQVRRTLLVDHESYLASVERRLAKIGARLRNPSFPDEWTDLSASTLSVKDLVQDATRYLRETGQTTLIDRSDRYEAMPTQVLDTFLNELLRLSKIVAASKVSWRTFSLAASFLSQNRFVIWDFFPPGNHDTATLLDLMP